MNLSITFSKYGREFEASKLTIDELRKSVRKGTRKQNRLCVFEATSDNNTKYLIDGTLYNNGFCCSVKGHTLIRLRNGKEKLFEAS